MTSPCFEDGYWRVWVRFLRHGCICSAGPERILRKVRAFCVGQRRCSEDLMDPQAHLRLQGRP